MRSNQKSTRRYKSHKSPRKKRINGDLEDLGQDIKEEDFDDLEEEDEAAEDAINDAINDDFIGDPVVPEIIDSNFEVAQASSQKKGNSDLVVELENTG